MGYTRLFKIALSTLLMLFVSGVDASNRSMERRIANSITTNIIVGEPIRLPLTEFDFLAIHTPSLAGETNGGVILLHDAGGHPDWPEVIHPLRVQLPKRGWETLSVQLPIDRTIKNEKLISEAPARIQAGIDYFTKTREVDHLVLIGHGLGARMAIDYLSKNKPESVHGLVFIGLSSGKKWRDNPILQTLSDTDSPMLDIIAERDKTQVVSSAELRKSAMAQSGNNYRMDVIAGAEPTYRSLADTLQYRVGDWIGQLEEIEKKEKKVEEEKE